MTSADHFTLLPYEKRYKAAHVARCFAAIGRPEEAFSEAYHTVATHPQILEGLADANAKYDVFGNYSRAMSPRRCPAPAFLALNPPTWMIGLFTKLQRSDRPSMNASKRAVKVT